MVFTQVKVVSVYDMKAYGVESIAAVIVNLSTGWRSVVCFKLWLPYP
jgi:hypothetical protein